MSAAGGRGEDGALAILLHTHMPYVEGFGTWPFGEEWLWEAIVGSYLPLLDLLDAGAPLTLSLTPVLCDQLEAAGVEARLREFIAGVRRRTHADDAAGLREAGHEQLAAEVDRSYGDYEAALAAMQRRPEGLLAALGRHAAWTSSATHAILPLLASDAGVRAQVHSGVASHRRRFGDGWRGGFWLPECAYAPWLQETLHDAGARVVCVELTNAIGLGAAGHLRPLATDSGLVLAPIDRATMSLVWSDGGYPAAGAYRDYHHHTVHHHNPWDNSRGAYDHDAALALARRHAADFVARTRERLERAGGGLVVCALDTELLGHWWYEGVAWLAEVLAECGRRGLELLRLEEALERFEPAPAGTLAQAPVSWGTGGDLSTWSGPAVAEMAFAVRAAELELLASDGAVSREAVRELLALQSSDWPFMVTRGVAEPYARERFAGHEQALRRARLDPASATGALRNLAIDADPQTLLAP